jgi:hypothetical protein
MVDSTVPNPNRPGLSIRLALKEWICGSDDCFTNLKISGFDIVHQVSL